MPVFRCPDCRGKIRYDADDAGCLVECPHCGEEVHVPGGADRSQSVTVVNNVNVRQPKGCAETGCGCVVVLVAVGAIVLGLAGAFGSLR